MHDTLFASSPTHGAPTPAMMSPPPRRRVYLKMLLWAFTALNMVRLLSYLPTVWAIHAQGDSSQHSLWTWVSWMGANATMAAWLYEQNGARLDKAVAVSAANAVMCAVTLAVIVWYRI